LSPRATRDGLRALTEIFDANSHRSARERGGGVIERLRAPEPNVAELLEAAEENLLAFYGFPAALLSKLRSTNPLERVNREIGRRADVVRINTQARSGSPARC
jgi:transposase-like protein